MKESTQAPVTIKIFNNPSNLHIAKSFLESEGIICFVKDELTIQTNPLYTNAIGGIKLQVRSEDVKQAVVLLITSGFAKKEDYEIPKELLQMHKFLTWVKKTVSKIKNLTAY